MNIEIKNKIISQLNNEKKIYYRLELILNLFSYKYLFNQ